MVRRTHYLNLIRLFIGTDVIKVITVRQRRRRASGNSLRLPQCQTSIGRLFFRWMDSISPEMALSIFICLNFCFVANRRRLRESSISSGVLNGRVQEIIKTRFCYYGRTGNAILAAT